MCFLKVRFFGGRRDPQSGEKGACCPRRQWLRPFSNAALAALHAKGVLQERGDQAAGRFSVRRNSRFYCV